jgi:alkylhydroperoxidase/carboxymuconolactone decarboxylase family protein YurZ
MANSDIEDIKQHYFQTLGNMPGAIRAMAEYAPDAFRGYTVMREYIYREPKDGGALDLKTKELLYVILDVVCGNLPGAKNHLDAAMRAGLTLPELSEACMQTMAVFGIHTWGMTGYPLCDYMRDKLAEEAKPKRANGRGRRAAKGTAEAPAKSAATKSAGSKKSARGKAGRASA